MKEREREQTAREKNEREGKKRDWTGRNESRGRTVLRKGSEGTRETENLKITWGIED